MASQPQLGQTYKVNGGPANGWRHYGGLYLIAAYLAALTLTALLILGNRDFAIVWTMLMLPVFVGAVLYARWVYVAMLTIYVLMSALLILIGAPKDPADSARTTAVFLVAVAIGAEALHRFVQARERARAALNASEERFRSLSVMAPVGIFETNIEGMCTYTNPRWQALTGLDAQASVGRGWIDAVHPDDRHAVLDAWIWATRLGREYTGRFRVVNRQGEVRWVRLHSTVNHDGERITGRVGTLEDITEQRMAAEALQQANDALEKRVAERTERLTMVVSDLEQEAAERKWAEEALRQSEERFARAFHASPSAVIITSRVDGRTVDVNESFLRLTGFNREEVLGSTIAQMAIWKYPEERARLIDLMGTEGSISDYEMTIRSRTGKEHTVVVSAERMPLGDEECVLAIGTDITERKALEQHLLEYAEAQRTLLSQRIAAQEAERRRLSMDVHDGPLQSLGVSLMALDRAIRRLDSGELEVAHRELRYLRTSLSGTVSELRSVLADLSVENLTTHGLVFALQSNVERFSEVTGIRVVVDDNIEGRLPGDIELLLYRLVQEALANVRKHSEAQRVLVRIEQADGNVVLTVRDDGRGFNPEEVLARHRDGEHLGLASMRERVQAIGGSLSIVSAPEQGTTLTFRCPLPGPDLIPDEMHSGQDLTA